MCFLVILFLILLLTLCLLCYSNVFENVLEGYEYNTVYYCNDCDNKNFGQCTRCASCVWVRGFNYDKNEFFAECRKGDEHGLWKKSGDINNEYLFGYSREPLYNGPYFSMI